MSRAARKSVSLPSGVRGGPFAAIANHGAILRRCITWDGPRGLRLSRRDRGARDLRQRAVGVRRAWVATGRPCGRFKVKGAEPRRRQSVRGAALAALSQSAASRALVIVRDFLAARMLLKASSPQRRQLEYSTHALIQPKVPNPSPVRAPANRSGVKRAWTGSELLHEPDLVFPRPSYFSRYFHPAVFPANYDP